MQIFLDTADLDLIRRYAKWWVIDGVTTNPSIIAKQGVNFEQRIKEICEIISGPVSAEVIATDVEGMLVEGRRSASWADNVYVKLPTTPAGLEALSILSQEGIRTNMTLVFSLTQAVLVAKAGATLVSPFIGRLDDIGVSGIKLIEEIRVTYDQYGFDTQLLAASIRSLEHVKQCMLLGADIATLPPKLMDEMMHHDLTDQGIAAFLADWQSALVK